jgi:uncharacterized SAM-binding protein YcdF (DUF218 family)
MLKSKWWQLVLSALKTRKARVSLLIFFIVVFSLGRSAYVVSHESLNAWTDDIAPADCGVVLTGSAHRIREALALLSRGQIQKLVVAGVHPQTDLLDLLTPEDLLTGVDKSRVVIEKRSTTTFGNAQQSLPIVEALGCTRVILITSQMHMHRALKTFFAAYPSNIKLVKYSVPPSVQSSSWWEFGLEVFKTSFYSLWAFW